MNVWAPIRLTDGMLAVVYHEGKAQHLLFAASLGKGWA